MQDLNKNRCRICLGNQNLSDIFTKTILEKIKYCTTVQASLEAEFPSKICKKCEFYLNITYVFKMVCEWADMKLQNELRQTKTAQFNKFSCVEDAQNENLLKNIHLIEFLLKRECLETYKYINFKYNEEEDCDSNIYNKQRDINYIQSNLHTKFAQEEINTRNEENSNKKAICIENEDIFYTMKEDGLITQDINEEASLIAESNGLNNEYICLINGNCLKNEEIVDISSFQEPNVIENEEIFNVHHEEVFDQEEQIDPSDEESLMYGCDAHEDGVKSIYGKVCLNIEDPLLHNHAMLLEETLRETEESLNEKHITLNNISLDDFEDFEKEQLSEENVKNKKTLPTENRVGRHIAKKNAGQPPKRYSPTSEPGKFPCQKEKVIKDDSPTSPSQAKFEEDKKTEENIENILGQEYILENDLSMPEAIFEETIVTDGFYFGNEEVVESNFDDPKSNSKNQKKRTRKKKGKRNNGSAKLKKKVNVFIDRTVINSVRLKQNKNRKNKLHHFNSSTEIKTETNNIYSSCNTPQKSTPKKRFASKKRKGTTCKLCNKSFPFPSHLQRHLTSHIGIKRFTCKHCNKEFLHRYNLSVHMRSHTGNFPLECNICNRGFVSSSVLERHKRIHTGETPFQCQYCLQLFSHASSLSMHEKMHLNRPSFPCDVCYKVFSYKSSLNAHKKGHTGLKPHSCSVCHKRFTRRTSVMRHMASHSEVKKFKCGTCGEVLDSQSNLVKHQKIH